MNCPLCNGDAVYLGTLGRLAHFRCQACGIEHHRDASVIEDELLEDMDDGPYDPCRAGGLYEPLMGE